MSGVRPIIQITPTECGLCCIGMVLRHHGSKESIVSLRSSFDVGRDGMSVRDLRQVLEERGLQVRVFRATRAGLAGVPLPVIALWNGAHFVVVERVGSSQVTVLDPAEGRVVLTLEEFDEHFSGIIVVPTPADAFDPEARREPWIWREFLGNLRTAKAAIAWLAVVSAVIYGVSLLVPRITQKLIDSFAPTGSLQLDQLVPVLAVVAAIAFLGLIQAQVHAVTRLTVTFGRSLMSGTFLHMLRLPFRYFTTRSPGELVYRLASIGALRDLLAGQVVSGVLDVGMILVVFAYMAHMSWTLALVALVFFVLVCAVLGITRKRILNALNAEMTEFTKTQGLQIEAISSIASLRVAGVEDHFYRDWQETYERGLDRMRERAILQGWVSSFVSVVQTGAPLLLLLLGLVLAGRGEPDAGSGRRVPGDRDHVLRAVVVDLRGVHPVPRRHLLPGAAGGHHPRPTSSTGPTTAGPAGSRGASRCGTCTSGSPATARTSCAALSFDVEPGQQGRRGGPVGLGQDDPRADLRAGCSGPPAARCGSTGGTCPRWTAASFYAQIGVVPQEIDLQNKTIRENITMGSPMDAQRLVEAAAAAQIHDEIMRMPLGYETQISEMGGNVSGGQRQRIAFARAIYKNPRLLVLDEATSSLDVLNETKIADYLAQQRCTRIVIAHRMSTVVDADLILVMHDGMIVQRGTHDELFLAEGRYRELFSSQRDAMALVASVEHAQEGSNG